MRRGVGEKGTFKKGNTAWKKMYFFILEYKDNDF